MKTNKLIFAAAALMALAACSSDAELDEQMGQRVPVKLSYSNVDATETRAEQDLNQGNFATGENVMVRISNTGANAWTDYTFTTAAEGAMTAPATPPYYPAGTQNIDIVAYYPATAGTTFSVATDQTADASYKASDLMFASKTNQAKQAEAVNLSFEHKMVKLCVNITNGQGVTSITSVSIQNVKPTVSFNQATGAVGEATGTATSIAVSNNGAAVIPAQTINGDLLSIVTDKGTATYSVANKAFEAGRLYTLNITVNLRAVGLTTAITGWTSQGTVTVNPVTNQKTPAGLVAVDLGYVFKWANMNVGAENVTDYGTYFAWGETYGLTVVGSSTTPAAGNAKTSFAWDEYGLCNGGSNSLYKYNDNSEYGFVDNLSYLRKVDDAAFVNWGGNWRMPMESDWAWLMDGYNCTTEWTNDYNGTGVHGLIVTSKVPGFEGNSIFLPAAGTWKWPGGDYGTDCYSVGNVGLYWLRGRADGNTSMARSASFSKDTNERMNNPRCWGFTVRPLLTND
ncbi:MAG: fimbrillin family protein [Bacteroidaceae bacterium]|nr:fimbrillin family protein [Bacteroidaceae bacterium]